MKHKEETNAIQQLIPRLLHHIDMYMASNDGESEATKMAVVMSAVTRILAAMAVSVDMPEAVAHQALSIEMRLVLEAMAEDEVKH